ncbi:MAG: hypothetical protein IT320_26910 [Anaerolineae bacterium]|nr:hypothetical protein [Anaerolineae bacterium]
MERQVTPHNDSLEKARIGMAALKRNLVTVGLCAFCILAIAYFHPLILALADTDAAETPATLTPTATETLVMPPTSTPLAPESTSPPAPTLAATPTVMILPGATLPPPTADLPTPEPTPGEEAATDVPTAQPPATVDLTPTTAPDASAAPTVDEQSTVSVSMNEVLPSPTATVEMAPSVEVAPTLTVESVPDGDAATDAPPTLTPAQEAVQPTATLTAAPTATPTAVTQIILLPDATTLPGGDTLTLTVYAEGLTAVQGMVLVCATDAALLRGVEARAGDLLPMEQVTTLDSGYAPDGSWALAATHNQIGIGIEGAGVLWQMTYETGAPGTAAIACELQLSDLDGYPLPPLTAEMTLTIDPTPEASPEVTVTETATPSPTSEPELTAAPSATPTPTDEPTATATPVDPEQIAAHYGLSVPPADPALDLNGDGIINVYDLVLASRDQ